MNTSEATALIRTPLIEWAQPQSWCDLGSGSGTFTVALAQLLVPGSTIYAVDFDQRALEEIPDQHNRVEIRKIVGDLQSSSLRLPSVAGILMANTLHFIQEQQIFLKRLRSVADHFLIVEYERSKPSRWGPYPVGFERLRQLFTDAGVERVEKLTTKPSRFGGTICNSCRSALPIVGFRLGRRPQLFSLRRWASAQASCCNPGPCHRAAPCRRRPLGPHLFPGK